MTNRRKQGGRASLFYRLDKAFNRLVRGLQILFRGFWLGFLDHDGLQRVTELRYSAWDQYLSQKHNESGLLSWEKAVLEEYYSECHSLLVGSAGAGREVIGLSQLEYDVDAFDCVEPLVKVGQQLISANGISANLRVALPDQLPDGLGQYDGLIVGWSGYMHIVGRDRRIAFLKQFRSHVNAGAPLLLSFFPRSASSTYFSSLFRIANQIRRLRRSPERVELGDNIEGTFDHYFVKGEIQSEMDEAGFELIHYATVPYGHAVGRAV